MTKNKPSAEAVELAENLADAISSFVNWQPHPRQSIVNKLTKALTAAEERGAERMREMALNACELAWMKCGDRLPHHGDCMEAIRIISNATMDSL